MARTNVVQHKILNNPYLHRFFCSNNKSYHSVYNNNCCKWPQIEKKNEENHIQFTFKSNKASLPQTKTKLSIFLPNPSLRPNEVLDCIQVLFQSITRPLDFDDTRIWQKMMKMDDRGNASSFD